MHGTLGRALTIGAATLAMAAPAAAAMAGVGAARQGGTGQPAATDQSPRTERLPNPERLPNTDQATILGAPAVRHVVLVGIGGLRWSDVSPTATPALWRLASKGSVGSLVVSGIHPRTCPADGWLTLNAAARASAGSQAAGPCHALPAVLPWPTPAPAGTPAPARVPAMPGLVTYNTQFSYNPQWGLLATAPGPGRCATAVGPGAAIALASRAGQVASYLPSPSALSRTTLARCPLTVIDLGNLPAGQGGGTAQTADRQLARIAAALPADSTLVVFAPGEVSQPHLRVVMVSGPHFTAGLLTSASTRRQGMALLIDLTPTVLTWLGTPVPSALDGLPLTATARHGLPAALRTLAGQDAAAQVYRQTVTPFYQLVGFGYPVLFALIWVAPLARGARRRSRRAVAQTAGLWAASVPAGTFLASLVPWWTMPHPALVLYGLAVVWAAVVAAAALTGPWRRDPLGPPGVVAAVTLGVIGLDLMTGSHLAQETPFGLHVLEAGRFYGLGNNGLVIYGASGILCAAWLGGVALREGLRRRALLVMTGVTLFTVIAAGWPGFGAKVGGTIAMVPGFLVLLATAAKMRITTRRAMLVAVSGLALVTLFAIVSYFVPVAGHSDVGGFVGKALHGGAGAILHRKINSNLGSLTANPFIPVIPVVVIALGLMAAWPARLRCTLLVRAYQRIPLLRAALSAIWLMAVLGWFAEDSGATVPAAGMPLVLPLMVVILSSVAGADSGRAAPEGGGAAVSSLRPELVPGEPPAQAGGRATSGPGQPGYR